MKLAEIFRKYSDEQKSKLAFKEWRDKQGVCCKKCKGTDHYWKRDKWQYECKNCGFRTTLRSGTVMEASNMPYQSWMIAIGLTSATKKSFSALEIQRQLGHKRYEPIWLMMHKIRLCMGRRDAKYKLAGQVEIDEGFFESHRLKPEELKDSAKGPNPTRKRQVTVLVMAESELAKEPHKNKTRPKRKVGHLKMQVIDDLSQEGMNYEIKKHIETKAKAITDGRNCYSKLENILADHTAYSCNDPTIMHKVLPWVHIAISNAKKICLGIHHSIKREYMQNYLNEFCYKFNRRYLIDKLFDRLMIACIAAPWYDFRYDCG
jgi:ISXO2-like transposase domain